MRYIIFVILINTLLLTSSLAGSLNIPILNIPKGTTFTLNYELEVAANSDFIILGSNKLNELFNKMDQPYNNSLNNYKRFDDYLITYTQSVEDTYKNCLERHRQYYTYNNKNGSSSNTIINQGYNNTNIIINNTQSTPPTHVSYIGSNNCIKPEHSFSALIIDSDKAEGGGIFRDGYEFKVKRVRTHTQGRFNIIDITFKHKIAKGIRIVTTTSPKLLYAYHLQGNTSESDGFWDGLGNAIGSITNIAGDHFSIKIPSKRYFK